MDKYRGVYICLTTRSWEDGDKDQIAIYATDPKIINWAFWEVRRLLPRCDIYECREDGETPEVGEILVSGIDWKERLDTVKWLRAQLFRKGWVPIDLDPEYYGTLYVFREAVVP